MDAYSRHKEMINLYHLSCPGAPSLFKRDESKDRTDYDVLKVLLWLYCIFLHVKVSKAILFEFSIIYELQNVNFLKC